MNVLRFDKFQDFLYPLRVGPMDGGCLMVAEAIKQTKPGSVLVGLINDKGVCHHAVCFDGKRHHDAYGSFTSAQIIDHWKKHERVDIVELRLMERAEFLAEECGFYDEETVNKMVAMLETSQVGL